MGMHLSKFSYFLVGFACAVLLATPLRVFSERASRIMETVNGVEVTTDAFESHYRTSLEIATRIANAEPATLYKHSVFALSVREYRSCEDGTGFPSAHAAVARSGGGGGVGLTLTFSPRVRIGSPMTGPNAAKNSAIFICVSTSASLRSQPISIRKASQTIHGPTPPPNHPTRTPYVLPSPRTCRPFQPTDR